MLFCYVRRWLPRGTQGQERSRPKPKQTAEEGKKQFCQVLFPSVAPLAATLHVYLRALRSVGCVALAVRRRPHAKCNDKSRVVDRAYLMPPARRACAQAGGERRQPRWFRRSCETRRTVETFSVSPIMGFSDCGGVVSSLYVSHWPRYGLG